MDTIRLSQTLETFPHQDVIQYYIVSEFLKNKRYDNLMQLIALLDLELKQDTQLSEEQKACIQYLFRDWGYHHLKDKTAKKQVDAIFRIDQSQHKPGHFMEAIDFAKRNPKNNELLMRFGLTLLIHSSYKQAKSKIDAIEQLLTQNETSITKSPIDHGETELKTTLFILYNAILALYCIWTLTKITYPPL